MLMMPAAKSDAVRKTPHSCVLISANAACSCGETSEKRTYLLGAADAAVVGESDGGC
jgi:hypothetical protein